MDLSSQLPSFSEYKSSFYKAIENGDYYDPVFWGPSLEPISQSPPSSPHYSPPPSPHGFIEHFEQKPFPSFLNIELSIKPKSLHHVLATQSFDDDPVETKPLNQDLILLGMHMEHTMPSSQTSSSGYKNQHLLGDAQNNEDNVGILEQEIFNPNCGKNGEESHDSESIIGNSTLTNQRSNSKDSLQETRCQSLRRSKRLRRRPSYWDEYIH